MAKKTTKRSTFREKEDDDDEVDYGATADMHASDNDDNIEENEAIEEGSYDRDEDPEEDMVQKEEDSDTSSSSDEEDQELQNAPNNNTIVVDGGDEPCTFDLRNLLAFNAHPIDTAVLYAATKKKGETERSTIPSQVSVDERHLFKKAQDGCQQLIAALWQLPIEKSDVGPMVKLPANDDSRVPRALPLPPPIKETKWEQFAKAKGIGQNKSKRSRKVWDEATGEWKYRHGYEKANATDGSNWPIMEVKPGEDPYANPWEKQRDAKKARMDKNTEQRMRNVERSGGLTKGSTARTMKQLNQSRESGRAGGANDRNIPSGVPVDLKPSGRKGNSEVRASAVTKLRGKESTQAALRASQRSTASMGAFDQQREGEPERKTRKIKTKTDKPIAAKTELDQSMKVLKAIASGGGVEREKLKRKGKLAHGETAYDYEFNDGLGDSTFKKKKGRAGMGKAKKMTKKRVK